jgi:hypothetical protein
LDWVSLFKPNRKPEIASFQLKDAQGQPVSLPKLFVKVEDLVPLIPSSAYQKLEHAQ